MDLPMQEAMPEEGMERTAVGAVPDSMRTRERPLTAGRKPPKITSKVKEQKEEPGMQAPVAQAPQLITEGMMGEEDMFLAEEAPKPAEMLSAGGDQGKLVRELMQEKEKAIKEKEEPKEAAKEMLSAGGINMR